MNNYIVRSYRAVNVETNRVIKIINKAMLLIGVKI